MSVQLDALPKDDAARASVNVNLTPSSNLLSRLAFKIGAPRSLTVHRAVDLSNCVRLRQEAIFLSFSLPSHADE